jgi:D-sedoheptulose 7-phosphate isomerase
LTSLLRKNVEDAKATLDRLVALDAEVEAAAALMAEAVASGGKLLACGNGGSAADAMHFTTEMVARYDQDRRPYPAVCLSASASDLTAIANDYAFADVFARQVLGLGQPGDVLLAITTSGRSENVRRALVAAKERGVKTVALLGKGGGPTRDLADVQLIVPSDVTARIQEAQKLLVHTLCERVEERLRERGFA